MALMIQGFEQAFIVGFLLTAMPAFTHGPRCQPWELAWAVIAMLLFGIAAILRVETLAQVAFLSAMLLLWTAGLRRVVGNPRKPPEEFLFVAFGLALGTTGAVLLLAGSLGAAPELPARFAERLLSLGMVLSLVMGVGSLLVPTFAGMRDPLVIPGIAAPHARQGRRVLYGAVIATMAAAFVAEMFGAPRFGSVLRAVAVSTMGLWVWKLTTLPRRDTSGFALWSSGWLVMAGLWVVAIVPALALAGMHVVFIGGFALLTMGIGTRVVVSHGKHPLDQERRAINAWVLGLLAAAVAVRVVADLVPRGALHAYATSGALFILAWSLWAMRALPLVQPGMQQPAAEGKSPQ
jgi:uncharacterized protein involved in response to NO